jgi:hypothetical protein
MDDAKVLHACRLLYEALCDDLELRRLVVHAEPQHVSITIHTKRGRQESKVIVGEDSTTEKDSTTENVHLLDEWLGAEAPRSGDRLDAAEMTLA